MSIPAPPPAPVPTRNVLLLASLGLAFAVSSGDRALLAVLKTTLAGVLGFSQSDYSLLVGALLLPYALMLLAAGSLINRFGPRLVLTACLVVMSGATALASSATQFSQLLAPQVALGLAQACVAPTAAYLVATLLPPARQAVGYSAINAIQSTATILCPVYAAAITLTLGWRYAFLFLSAGGLIMAVVWWGASARWGAALTHHASDRRTSLAQLWRVPEIRAVMLARIVTDPFWFFFQFWQTAFLQEQVGASLSQIGRFAWIPPVAAVVGVFVAGAVSDALIARGRSAIRARLAVIQGATVLALAALALPSAGKLGLAVMLCALLYALCGIWLSLTAVLLGHVAPRPLLAPALGVTGALGCVSGISFNLLAGPVIERVGYTPLFLLGACLYPLACLLLRRADVPPNPAAASLRP